MSARKVLIIGAGGVGGVVTHKCAQAPEVFGRIVLASRTLARCENIQKQVRELRGRDIEIARVDADDVAQTVKLIRRTKPDLVLNVALPYQDLPIMDACLETGVDYLDTANYEPPDVAKFEYKWQWAYHERFRQGRPDGAAGLGLRSRRDQRVLRLRPEAPVRHDPHGRHPRLQRRPARPGLRHQLQPRDQHPRDHPAGPLLGEGPVDRDRSAEPDA